MNLLLWVRHLLLVKHHMAANHRVVLLDFELLGLRPFILRRVVRVARTRRGHQSNHFAHAWTPSEKSAKPSVRALQQQANRVILPLLDDTGLILLASGTPGSAS